MDEAFSYLDFDDDGGSGEADVRQPHTLALAVLKIWGRFFKRNIQWRFINLIGEGLERYIEMLKCEHRPL